MPTLVRARPRAAPQLGGLGTLGTLAMAILTTAAPTLAQESPSPGPLIDIVALMPTEIDGLATEIMVEHGPEHVVDLDPDDPRDAQELADIERFLEETGGTIDQLTTASAAVIDGTRVSIVAAARVTGADPDILTQAYVALLSDAMADGVAEPGRLDGKDVIVLTDRGAEDREPVYVYATADTVWLLAISQDAAVELLERLP